jgi:hypothetical protein
MEPWKHRRERNMDLKKKKRHIRIPITVNVE